LPLGIAGLLIAALHPARGCITIVRMLVFLIAAAVLALFTLMALPSLALGLPWLPLVVTFVLIPLLDGWVGTTPGGHQVRTEQLQGGRPLLPARYARWLPRLQVPLQLTLLAAGVALAPAMSALELLYFTLAVGVATGGIGITVAHELGHRANVLDRWAARVLLVTVGYGHFYVEHNRGHHVRVATPDDPATAPAGMTVYRFILRSVVGSFAHAWRLERMRLQAQGRSPWHLANWVLTASLASLALAALAFAVGGLAALSFVVAQAAVAVVLLEITNYMEHYGLQRRDVPGGRYEPVRPEHSWNADFPVSNWLLFNLQLHSDHHAHVARPFEDLRSMPQAPQLPAGYPTMLLVALVPPLWFHLMDPRLPQRA
jgi:alkane 1-monooxygenase